MKSGSLFSGTGALDIAAEAVLGCRPAWFCEYDAAPSLILAHNWPAVQNYGDVTKIDWAAVEPIEVLTAGYPCQPFSLAGSRKGQDDVRHLWPYVAAAIRNLRPRYVLLENVRGHLSLGFGDVLGDLAGIGYDAQWSIIRASAAGAPHRRERVFILATDAGGSRRNEGIKPPECFSEDRANMVDERGAHDQPTDWGEYGPAIRRWEAITGRPAPRPVVPTGRNGLDRLNPELPEWMMGFPAGHITGVPGLEWKDQLKAAGNGVVAQQAIAAYRHLMDVSATY